MGLYGTGERTIDGSVSNIVLSNHIKLRLAWGSGPYMVLPLNGVKMGVCKNEM